MQHGDPIHEERVGKLAREVMAQIDMLVEDLNRFPKDHEVLRLRWLAIRQYADQGLDLSPPSVSDSLRRL